MRNPLFFILLVWLCFAQQTLFSQKTNIDSLKQELSRAKNDTNKVNLLNILTYEVYINIEKSDKEIGAYIDSAIALSEKLNYLKGNLRARFNAGNIYKNTGRTDLAKQYLLAGLPLCEKLNNNEDYFRITNTLGICFSEEGNYRQASEYYFTAIRYAEKAGNKKLVSTSYNSLGNLYNAQNEKQKALHYFMQALKLNAELDDKLKMSFNYINIGSVYSDIQRFDSAYYYFNKALVIQTAQKNIVGQGYSYNGIGYIYFKKNEPEAAIDYYKRAWQSVNQSEDADLHASLLNRMGAAYLALNKIDEAKNYYLEAESYSKKVLRLPELSEALEGLSKIFKLKKDYQKAFEYFTNFTALKDSITNTATGKKISSLEYNYQIEQDKKIAQLENEKIKIKHEEEVKQQRTIIWSISIFLIAVFGMSIFLYRAYKQKQAANLIVNKQKQKVENQKRIIEVKQKEILDSINYAKRIQFALLAHTGFLKSVLPNHFILFKPKDIVSGDFYWATQHNNQIYVAICDCTGHGVPGAFMSVLNIGFLNEAIKEKNITAPNEIFNYVRKRLIDNLAQDNQKDGMDGVLLCIDPKTKKITYAAANNSPVLIRNKTVTILEKDKMPVGKGEKNDDFQQFTINYELNDAIYLYTDGYADQFGGPKGKKFKYKQLNELLLQIHELKLEDQKTELEESIKQWKGLLEQIDDLCIMGIKF